MPLFFRSGGIRLLTALTLLVLLLARPSAAQIQTVGTPVALTSEEDAFMNPSWSPDGDAIAFTKPGYEGISVLDLQSGRLQTITDEPTAGFGFGWAPDGESIVARVARYDGPRRLNAVKVFDAGTGDARQLTDYRSMMPALPHWDGDGDRVFLLSGPRLEVFEIDEPSAMKQNAGSTELVPAEQGLVRVELTSRQVEPMEAVDDGVVLNLTRSPDRSRVAFERMGGNMYAMNADGSNLVDLGPGNRPAWSPDGEWIVFVRAEDDGHHITASDLYAVRADGSGLTRLTATSDHLEMNPSWSPDGTRIAYDNIADGVIYVLSVSRQ